MSQTAPTQKSDAAPGLKGALKEWVNEGTLIGAVVGAGAGVWAALVRKVLDEEKDVLIAVLGAAIGLLAVALTAMTLVVVFLGDDLFRTLVKPLRIERFFRPFVVVAMVSAGAAIVSLAGVLDIPSGPTRLRDILFGVSVWLVVWAIVGAVHIVRVLVGWAVGQARIKAATGQDAGR